MPRSIWNGTLAFGLVRVPVKLYSATESKRIPLRERHLSDGAAIEHRRLCVKEGKEVPYSEIVKGYEVSAGAYVVLTKEEIAAAEGPEAHVVEIEHFVSREEIDPVYYERAYYLGPGKLGEEPYRLLHEALSSSDRVGIGRFVFHNKAHLVAVRALGDVIVLHTMRFADELVPEGELEVPKPDKTPSELELDTAELLIGQLDSKFEPESYANSYRDAVLAMIEKKARGEAIEVPESRQPTPEGDLLSALQASLEERAPRRRRAKETVRPKSTPRPGAGPARPARTAKDPTRAPASAKDSRSPAKSARGRTRGDS
ncbi:MAG TPA: Ku protein [Solirubrobacteraceae bacterium]|jgi:DNA end-binding protein Ku|nr:Ku protein [Solirubrobacteraceae bacterium]